MSKKLLSEAQLRRFAKLASLPSINEKRNPYGRDAGDELESQRSGGYGSGPKNRGDSSEKSHAFGKRLQEDGMEDIEDEVSLIFSDYGY